jgi:hypothetical protein
MYGTKIEMAVMILSSQYSKPHHSVQWYNNLASTRHGFIFRITCTSFNLNIPNFCTCMKLHLFGLNVERSSM